MNLLECTLFGISLFEWMKAFAIPLAIIASALIALRGATRQVETNRRIASEERVNRARAVQDSIYAEIKVIDDRLIENVRRVIKFRETIFKDGSRKALETLNLFDVSPPFLIFDKIGSDFSLLKGELPEKTANLYELLKYNDYRIKSIRDEDLYDNNNDEYIRRVEEFIEITETVLIKRSQEILTLIEEYRNSTQKT